MGYYDDYLEHHGIKGQKWGIRRFQNPDGSLTDKGQKRYNMKEARKEAVQSRRDRMRANAEYRSAIREPLSRFKKVEDAQLKNLDEKEKAYENAKKTSKEKQQAYKDAKKEYKDSKGLTDEQKAKLKKAAIIGGAAVGTALAAYGGYKLYQLNKPSKAFTPEQLNAMGIETVQPNRIEINRVEPNRINLNTSNGSSSSPNERLQKTLSSMTSMNISNSKTVSGSYSDSYTRDLLKKNGGALGSYTMNDLKKLDLY